MKLDVYTAHYDDNCWLNPKEFVPERFDTESDFYKESLKQGKVRNVYSRRVFSHGNRACPGMTLGVLQIKIIIAYLLMKIDYEIDEKWFSNEGVGFGLGSEINVPFVVRKL